MGDVTALSTIDIGSVVYLKDDVLARELIGDGEKREDEGDNLKGSGFTTVGFESGNDPNAMQDHCVIL